MNDYNQPSVNVDGTPMMNGIDINGNPFGVTNTYNTISPMINSAIDIKGNPFGVTNTYNTISPMINSSIDVKGNSFGVNNKENNDIDIKDVDRRSIIIWSLFVIFVLSGIIGIFIYLFSM